MMKVFSLKKGNVILIIFIPLFWFISCNNLSKKGSELQSLNVDSVLTFIIVKNTDSLCDVWKEPQQSDILPLLYSLKEVGGREWNDCYGDWSCGIEGKLLFKGKEYFYRLDAGGWIILSDGDNHHYFVCKSEECWQYFPSESFCDEEGNIKDFP